MRGFRPRRETKVSPGRLPLRLGDGTVVSLPLIEKIGQRFGTKLGRGGVGEPSRKPLSMAPGGLAHFVTQGGGEGDTELVDLHVSIIPWCVAP